MKQDRRHNGFSLIELLVVIAIIGILSAIAVPAYGDYVVKANRRAAQAFLLDVVNREKQYLIDARTYTDNLSTLGVAVPTEVSSNYTMGVTVTTAPLAFTVSATPIAGSRQASDGTLSVTDTGVKSPSSKW